MDQTEGVLTTRKLQALLESCINSKVTTRRELAEELGDRGRGISVHGIDAWFKRTDSNYSLQRPSLNPKHASYAVPKTRWSGILEVFGLQVQDLEVDDEQFREWIFSKALGTNGQPLVLAQCYGSRSSLTAQADALRLRRNGMDVLSNIVDTQHSEWSVVRAVQGADALLLYLDHGFVTRQKCKDVVAFAQTEQLQIVAVEGTPGIAQQLDLPPMLSVFNAEADYAEALSDVLAGIANRRNEPQANETGWSVSELVTTRPSIAVLPFANITGEKQWDALADAMAEDIIVTLARLPELFVTSSSTTRMYAGQFPDSRQVQRDLGVRYVLEGTVRKTQGNQIRVTAQLVDASYRRGLWSNRFDRGVDDPLEVLDELAIDICAQLEPTIRYENIREGASLPAAPAWRLWQEGWQYLFVDAPLAVPARSIDLFLQALKVDPEYPLAHAGYSIALSTGVLWGGLSPQVLPEASEHAEFSAKHMPENAATSYAMGMLAFVSSEPLQRVVDYLAKAVELEPSNAMYHGIHGFLLGHLGRTAEGVQQAQYAMRLSPNDTRHPFLCYMLGNALIADNQFAEGIETFARATVFSEVDFVWLCVAYAHFRLGDRESAAQAVARIEKPRPLGFYRYAVAERLWFNHPRQTKAEYLELLMAVLAPPPESA